MRFLMKVSIPIEVGNAAVKAGTIGDTINRILADINAEAAYFTTVGGRRGGIIVVDLQDASEIPAVAEPWFLAFNASVDLEPAMTPEDLGKAGSAMAHRVEKYS